MSVQQLLCAVGGGRVHGLSLLMRAELRMQNFCEAISFDSYLNS